MYVAQRAFSTVALFFLLLSAMALSAAPAIFFVATNGNDQWSGRISSPNVERTDGPLATIDAALRVARAARAGASDAVTILVRQGIHELAKPIVLTPEDSGASAAAPLTIANCPKEAPILSGGRRIAGWRRVSGQREIWQADVPEVRAEKWYFGSLFVNGRRATRARTPNEGSFFRMQGERFIDQPVHFRFKPGDIKPAWTNEPDAELVAFEKWTDFRQHIRMVNIESNIVQLSSNAAPHTREAGARYFVENTAGGLDAPGEWYLDRKTGIVRYWPLPGEEMAKAEVIAPRLQELVSLKGDFGAKRSVQHVVVRGLTFSYTDWSMPKDGYTDSQAAVRVRGDLFAEGAAECVIEDCTFSHLGGYAIDLGRGCQRNRIVGNEVFDIGAGGVRLGEPGDKRADAFTANHSHTVTDNHLHALGRIYAPAVGVFILQSGTNRVAHNHIHDLYYTAVSVGWNWGYQETPCRENVIEFNHMHDIGQSMLSDMGAVYTLGIQRGTVVRNNLIHDVNSFTYGGWGLYPDEGSTDIVWENNVVYRTKSAGFHQHYGRENIVRNNVFAFGKEYQLMRTREEEHVSFIFTNNIVYFDSGHLLGSNWKNERYVIENNLYFDARIGAVSQEIKFADVNLEKWRARGHDTNSVRADPLFVAPDKFDFTLKSDSPALKMGFKPIDVTGVGLRSKGSR
jgi:hypothetical protein